MSKDIYIYLTILGMAIVSYVPRVLPLVFFSRYKMSRELERFISYFPVSILTALVIKEIFFVDNLFTIDFRKIIPAIITYLISKRYKSIGLSIITGVLSYIIVKMII